MPAIYSAPGRELKPSQSLRAGSDQPSILDPAYSKVDLRKKPPANDAYGKLPLVFEVNQGQADPNVRFVSQGGGYGVFLTSNEAVLALQNADTAGSPPPLLRMRLKRANQQPQIEGIDEMRGRINYFMGTDPTKWRTSVPAFARIRLKSVYPGVDLVYYGNQQQLEYDFIVAPGADPSKIALEFEGARKLRLDQSGDLILTTPSGDLRQRRPVVYQEVNGSNKEVAARTVIKGKRCVAFKVGRYDKTRPLVIDPVLSYSTFFGNGRASCSAIAVDSQGNTYVAGSTSSPNFQLTPGALKDPKGAGAVFVSKLNAAGDSLIYSSVFGGSGYSTAKGISIDAEGNAYVAGYTAVKDFPVTPGAFQGSNNSKSYNVGTAFVVKLNPTGSALSYSTYLGGTGFDMVNGIAADAAGSAYVTGITTSGDFPTTSGALQIASLGGDSSLATPFVAKLAPTGSALAYSTYLGGNGDKANGIAIDSSGNAYITGTAGTPEFPATPGEFQKRNTGTDVFVTKINAHGSEMIYSALLGGEQADEGNAIAVDSEGNAYVTGTTASADFPITSGFQRRHAGSQVWKSTDGAINWTGVGNGLPKSSYVTGGPLIDPKDPATMYVAAARYLNVFEGGVYKYAEGGFFKTTNGGDSWKSYENGIPGDYVNTLFPGAMAIDPVNTSTIYFLPYKSTDGGDTWQKLNLDSINGDYSLQIDPKTPSTLYLAAQGAIGKSIDGGQTWKLLTNGLPAGQGVFSLAIDPQNTNILYAGTGTGLFKSTNAGSTWSAAGIEDLFIRSVVVDPKSTSTVYAYTYRGNTPLSDTGRGNPRKRAAQSITPRGPVKSTNGGNTWEAISEGFDGNEDVLGLVILIDPQNPSTLYINGARSVSKSTDGGGHWLDTHLEITSSRRLAIDPKGNVYLGTSLLQDAFVCKLNSTGTDLVYSTFLGGVHNDTGLGIAIDSKGHAIAVGTTQSRDFPVKKGAFQTAMKGITNTFVVKLGAQGTALDYATYLGGSLRDFGIFVAADSAGNAYVAGNTISGNSPQLSLFKPASLKVISGGASTIAACLSQILTAPLKRPKDPKSKASLSPLRSCLFTVAISRPRSSSFASSQYPVRRVNQSRSRGHIRVGTAPILISSPRLNPRSN